MFVVFFFKQKTAYEMRISDWSSDVCSSDLFGFMAKHGEDKLSNGGAILRSGKTAAARPSIEYAIRRMAGAVDSGENVDRRLKAGAGGHEIGRASCRERGGRYVEISVVAVALKKKNTSSTQRTTR